MLSDFETEATEIGDQGETCIIQALCTLCISTQRRHLCCCRQQSADQPRPFTEYRERHPNNSDVPGHLY